MGIPSSKPAKSCFFLASFTDPRLFNRPQSLSCEMWPSQKSQLFTYRSQRLPRKDLALKSPWQFEVVDRDLTVGGRNEVKEKPLLLQKGQANHLWLKIKNAPTWQKRPPPSSLPALTSCDSPHHSLTWVLPRCFVFNAR